MWVLNKMNKLTRLIYMENIMSNFYIHCQCIHYHDWMHDTWANFNFKFKFYMYHISNGDNVYIDSVYKINSNIICITIWVAMIYFLNDLCKWSFLLEIIIVFWVWIVIFWLCWSYAYNYILHIVWSMKR